MDFSSVYNTHEKTIFEAVASAAARYPAIADDAGLLADVACVALNRLPPRYIRHTVDFSFYLTEQERLQIDTAIVDAVAYAFSFVSARTAMRSKSP